MIRVRRLTTPAELAAFRAAAHRVLHIEYPLDYLERSRVIGVCDEGGELLGGFAIDSRGPFRSLTQIPAEDQARMAFELAELARSAAEINGLWLSGKVRSPLLIAWFWLTLGWEMVRSGRRRVVYSYVMSDARLKRMWGAMESQVLYQGWVDQLPGMTGPERESVECARIWTAVLTPFLRPGWFARRVLGRTLLQRPALAPARTLSLSESPRVNAVR
jgi:hypothetical protein